MTSATMISVSASAMRKLQRIFLLMLKSGAKVGSKSQDPYVLIGVELSASGPLDVVLV